MVSDSLAGAGRSITVSIGNSQSFTVASVGVSMLQDMEQSDVSRLMRTGIYRHNG